MKKAIVLGASGLVGAQLLQQLLDSPHYTEVLALVRRPLDVQHPKFKQVIFDFDHPAADLVLGDDLFCALGTTLKKAGSKAAQYRIDCQYPTELGAIARQNGVQQYLLVSSVGADAKASGFYLRTKGELEEKIQALDFPCFVVVRPSFLLGERSEFRLGEKIGIILAKVFNPLLPRRYRGIQAAAVAQGLITRANKGLSGMQIVENEDI